jgi:hypothetical protein
VQVRLTAHFLREQQNDGITEEEITLTWKSHDLEVPSQDHPGAVVRTARQLDGSLVSVVAKQTEHELVFISTWRDEA